MAVLKRAFSVILALVLLLTAVLILGLAIGRTFNSLANIFYLIRDYHFRLKAFHMDYCWVHNIINYDDYYSYYERAVHQLIFSSGFSGDITLKSPVLCMIAQTVASITATISLYAGAFAIFFLAIVAATYGKNKILKLVRTIFGVFASLSLIAFAITQLVMGFIKSCVWIRTVISGAMASYYFRYFLEKILYSLSFNIYTIIPYVVAVLAFVAAIFTLVCVLNKDKEQEITVKANEKVELAVEPTTAVDLSTLAKNESSANNK